jgi:hypothetical protein
MPTCGYSSHTVLNFYFYHWRRKTKRIMLRSAFFTPAAHATPATQAVVFTHTSPAHTHTLHDTAGKSPARLPQNSILSPQFPVRLRSPRKSPANL